MRLTGPGIRGTVNPMVMGMMVVMMSVMMMVLLLLYAQHDRQRAGCVVIVFFVSRSN